MVKTSLVDTRHGPMRVFDDDPGCSQLLKVYGEFSELELAVMSHYIRPDDVVLDVGAHIGAHTIPLARLCQKVYAVEPQSEARELLVNNLELNQITNVEVLPFALGEAQRTGYYSISHANWADSWGSVTMEAAPFDECHEVPVVPLDTLGIKPNFIKIDVEGMELHTLSGGQKTIAEARPYIFMEYAESLRDIYVQVMRSLRYIYSVMNFPFFSLNNWNAQRMNEHITLAHQMMLCLPYA